MIKRKIIPNWILGYVSDGPNVTITTSSHQITIDHPYLPLTKLTTRYGITLKIFRLHVLQCTNMINIDISHAFYIKYLVIYQNFNLDNMLRFHIPEILKTLVRGTS